MKAQRGGYTLKTGKIGYVNCIRQQIMLPGERINANLQGSVRLETMRERDVMRINAHLGVFMTPLRWLWDSFNNYVKEGPDSTKVPPTLSRDDLARYGVGSKNPTADPVYQWFEDSYHRVYNEWYKHPEDTDISGEIGVDGAPAVPLQSHWTRLRYDNNPDDTDDYTVTAGSTFNVQTLSEVQGKYRAAVKRDILSFNRWMELSKEMFNSVGDREVDQVPIMVDQVDLGVNPREMPATDGASLGQWQSMYDFQVDHSIDGIVAPEHCILTYMLTVRFPSVVEGQMPLSNPDLEWQELVGDPEWFAATKPQAVQKKEMFQGTSTTELGYAPAGWQWRCGHDVVGSRIDTRDSFPMMRVPDTAAHCKDATRVVDAFRSSALGDYLVDIYVTEESTQPIPNALESYMIGMMEDVTPGMYDTAEFPRQGKMR